MAAQNINKRIPKIRVLFAPLDWGLGHATRCIPLVREFQAHGCEVIIAAESATKALLATEFQDLNFIPLKGYRVGYTRKKKFLPLKIIAQIPRILSVIYYEQRWVKKVVEENAINLIIADNRFGLYHKDIPSIYLTHQLLIRTGRDWTDKIAQKIHFSFIRKYTGCWVPDFQGKENISGELGHVQHPPPSLRYIGCLSRFEKKEGIEKKYDLLLLISGPEPQRTIFEELLLSQLRKFEGRVLLVRGLPGNSEVASKLDSSTQLAVHDHLSAAELNNAILQADLVISRSGYTTIMDLVKLRQPAILVPTPGQTEQEYLAWHLMKQDFFYAVSQDSFSLLEVLKEAESFPFKIPAFDMDQYRVHVQDLLRSL